MKLQALKKKLFEFQKNNDALRLSVLRYLLAEVQNKEIEYRAEGKEITDEDLAKIIQKQIKRRNDSIELYKKGNRQDLVDQELSELEVLKEFEAYVQTPEVA